MRTGIFPGRPRAPGAKGCVLSDLVPSGAPPGLTVLSSDLTQRSLAIERPAAQRFAVDRPAFIVAQPWFVVREEDLPDEVPSAADTGLVEDAGEVLLHGVRREDQFVSDLFRSSEPL